MKKILIIVSAIYLLFPRVSGQVPEKKRYKSTQIKEAPYIDGIINENVWNEGDWVDDFTQFEPYNGKKPSQRYRV